MPAKPIQLFKDSAGVILLAVGSALFLTNWASPADLVTPLDPVFNLTLRTVFWAVAGVAMIVALICLFADRLKWPLCLLIWLGLNGLVYIGGVHVQGYQGLAGVLEGLSYACRLPPDLGNLLVGLLAGYLLAGGVVSLVWLRKLEKADQKVLKMHCPACGVHIKFAQENLGRQIPCPHCKTTIILQKPGKLKMACFFCHGHIEFPAHAIGTKMACPHCKMDITLKEPE